MHNTHWDTLLCRRVLGKQGTHFCIIEVEISVMQLRSQAKRQQQQQQQQNKGKGEDEVDNVFGLPPELMHMLAERLSLEDLAAASMACRSWSKLLRAGTVCMG